jgi:hypothetical protein
VPVAREEDDAADPLLHDPVEEFPLFASVVGEALVPRIRVQYLAAVHDNLEGRPAVRKGVLQPPELLATEHLLVGRLGNALGGAIHAVIEQEEIDVSPRERSEDALDAARAVAGIRPVRLEDFEALPPVAIDPGRVVRSEIVVVPDRVVMGGPEERLERRLLAPERVPALHGGDAPEVRLPVVDVVSEPEHHVGLRRGDRAEDLRVRPVRLSRPVHPGLVRVEAGSERDGEIRRVAPPLPELLGGQDSGRPAGREGRGRATDQDLVSVTGARFEAGYHEECRVIALLVGARLRRRPALTAISLRPVAQPHGRIRGRLDPHGRLGQIGVTEHRTGPERRLRRRPGDGRSREEDGDGEQRDEGELSHGGRS